MLKSFVMCSSVSRYCGHDICFSATNDFHLSWSRSELTDITVNLSFGYLTVSSFNSGTEARQGGHQVAQKSITTTFPASDFDVIASPEIVFTSNSGASANFTFVGWL